MEKYEIIEVLLSYIDYAINEGFPFPVGIEKDLDEIKKEVTLYVKMDRKQV